MVLFLVLSGSGKRATLVRPACLTFPFSVFLDVNRMNSVSTFPPPLSGITVKLIHALLQPLCVGCSAAFAVQLSPSSSLITFPLI